ncbi:MAG: Ribosomal RNA large subunit methyltransferase H [uncultured Bacteroidota bacterium]|jgi:23S rRNA (pseudouridine1915-N3)-methyltransferase|nr:MAG: Ribosomal RNA large subunit methyltransferase H [uncultured Bacteroidetes bacterium]
MKIKLLCVGKNNNSIWFDSMEHYSKRINQYVNFSIEYIPDVKTGKKSNPELVKNEEAKKLLLKIKKDDVVILLDEKGKAYSSKAFAETVEKQQNTGVRNLVFIIGGAFGFSENIYLTFDKKVRLSDMTFSHQMIRLFFCEQLYRAYTIIHKHPYHNS